MSETRRRSRFQHLVFNNATDNTRDPGALVDEEAPKTTGKISLPQHGRLSSSGKPRRVVKTETTTPKKVSFTQPGILSSSGKPKGVFKTKTSKLTRTNTKHRIESPWDNYVFVDEIVKDDDTVIKVRKSVSGQMFAFRTFPNDEKFEVIEQQFKLLDHHNVLSAQEFFRHGQRAFIRSSVMDISFDRIVMCRQYPSSRVLASMIGQTMDGLHYLVSNGVICDSLTCSKLMANKDGCVKIVAFSDAKIQEDIRASTTNLIMRLTSVMVLLMQKFDNEAGETSIQDNARWSPQDEACRFLQDLHSTKDFHTIYRHRFIDPKERDGDGFKDLIVKASDTTLDLHVRLDQREEFQPI
ncbi:hypothetical protein TSTA_062170 [Talaromyces stipitatus ATCC 10500]|uniref:Protein kinase domain-containing protein n=1 Tax=Talaromyces stipitatus (strain ATCC 10500 / CBS 375.48 / QM 6759 / NRRL 1006) TaxID=441959 RepID=B8LX79_TALSN|nr:uncharacterized protein TSTA_062170 [Talaromyces stipitatus ATCC 10500]EED22729.1 hypothetical protein TSTA_062170 [Talaromyces stipitatus ATCC 10500]